MTYIPNSEVVFADSPNLDAFGRLRTSQITTQADYKQLTDNLPLVIDEVGTGTSTYSNSATTLTTSASGQYVLRQTKNRGTYQSGKSQQILITFHDFQTSSNVIKRVGYFSSSTVSPYDTGYDGIYMENNQGVLSCVTSADGTVTSSVQRADWYDSLDGTGPSGLTHDFDKNTILEIDFEWLGVGRVRFSVITQGIKVLFHSIDFINGLHRKTPTGWVTLDPVFKGVYMKSPNQPLRWELRQVGTGSASMTHICATIGSEGALNSVGKTVGMDNGTIPINISNQGTHYVSIAFRKQSGFYDALHVIKKLTIISITNDNIFWSLRFNPTVTGTLTYTAIPNTTLEEAKGDGTITATGGFTIDCGYVNSGNPQTAAVNSIITPGSFINGTTDVVVLTLSPLNNNATALSTIALREIL